jgi:uncharacterized protein YukE
MNASAHDGLVGKWKGENSDVHMRFEESKKKGNVYEGTWKGHSHTGHDEGTYHLKMKNANEGHLIIKDKNGKELFHGDVDFKHRDHIMELGGHKYKKE